MDFKKIAAGIAGIVVLVLALLLLLRGCSGGSSEKVGEVSTAFNLFGSHKVEVLSLRDPKIEGIVIHISAAKTGGIRGSLGFAEDTSDASIDAAQNGPVRVLATLPKTERIFSESRSLVFKHLHVTRFWDAANNSVVYLTHSERLIDGSPKNAVASVALQSWDGAAPDLTKAGAKAPSQR